MGGGKIDNLVSSFDVRRDVYHIARRLYQNKTTGDDNQRRNQHQHTYLLIREHSLILICSQRYSFPARLTWLNVSTNRMC